LKVTEGEDRESGRTELGLGRGRGVRKEEGRSGGRDRKGKRRGEG
jgi:hypothetical protein